MKSAHTPTPWNFSGVGDKCTIQRATDSSVYHVATVETDNLKRWNGGTAEANAALIVKAVNAHEDAIELAQLARDFMLAIEGNDTLTENEKQVLDAAQKFLAKAKGE